MTDFLLRGARWVYPLIILAAGTLAAGIARADDVDPRPAAGIKEHSFLIEEAYSQEAGEIQHVVTLQRKQRDWFFHFSQEWALGSRTHQLGYSVPYSWLRSDGQRAKGIGDVEITYRYQAWLESATMPAFAPTLKSRPADRQPQQGARRRVLRCRSEAPVQQDRQRPRHAARQCRDDAHV